MNSVSRLNENAQKSGRAYPNYEFSSENGTYVCSCKYQGMSVSGAPAKNKKSAKELAATAALETLTDIMILAFDPSPLWYGAREVTLLLKKNGEEKHFVLRV